MAPSKLHHAVDKPHGFDPIVRLNILTIYLDQLGRLLTILRHSTRSDVV
jgi:hypothetical protein